MHAVTGRRGYSYMTCADRANGRYCPSAQTRPFVAVVSSSDCPGGVFDVNTRGYSFIGSHNWQGPAPHVLPVLYMKLAATGRVLYPGGYSVELRSGVKAESNQALQ